MDTGQTTEPDSTFLLPPDPRPTWEHNPAAELQATSWSTTAQCTATAGAGGEAEADTFIQIQPQQRHTLHWPPKPKCWVAFLKLDNDKKEILECTAVYIVYFIV